MTSDSTEAEPLTVSREQNGGIVVQHGTARFTFKPGMSRAGIHKSCCESIYPGLAPVYAAAFAFLDQEEAAEAAAESELPPLQDRATSFDGGWVTARDAYGTSLTVHRNEEQALRHAHDTPRYRAYWLPVGVTLPVARTHDIGLADG